ncbi:MAG: GNAT family N-acetyltransferase [Clostridia bacterium]|nr:GNAT family N-acetyltransferase [Clostridia bacterium]
MNSEKLREQWLAEEAIAHIHGWDFSHLEGRWEDEETLPWDYRTEVLAALRPDSRILDMDTGGGEFLLSLNHPHHLTAAIENYPPNVELCRETLLPLGIDFQAAAADGPLPFPDDSFDLVLNRHGSFDPKEVFRVLKPGGLFLTQQVGEDNDRELVELVLPGLKKPYGGWSMAPVAGSLTDAGFALEKQDEAFTPLRFFDTGALVWFARIIEWEFPGFSVERCFDRLLEVEQTIAQKGQVSGRAHRFLLKARKPLGEVIFREASETDLDGVMALYRSCTAFSHTHGNDSWSEEYPCREFAEEDLANRGLFVLEHAGEIVGAISLLAEDDWDELPVWQGDASCNLSRLGIKPQLQKLHLAERMMEEISRVARARGFRSTRHGSLVTNVASNRLYERMGYQNRGRVSMYGHDFHCFERIL